MTVFICFAKGILAGLVSAIVFELLRKVKVLNGYKAILLAAITAPIVNTAFFCTFLFVFYPEILNQWAGGTNALVYMITVLVGINFVVEFLCNAIICPIIGTKVKLK